MRIDNGAQAQVWQDVGGENQRWQLAAIPEKQLGELAAPPKKTGAPKSTRIQTGRGSRTGRLVKETPAETAKGKKHK